MAEPDPLILSNPDLTIDGESLRCLMSHIEIVPDVTTVEVKTSCGVREYPGTVKWALKASLYHSYDPVGTNAILRAAVAGGVPVDFTVVPLQSAPVSATNPEYTGQVIPKPFTEIAGDVGDASSFDLEWSIIGWGNSPTISTTPVAATGATAGTPGSFTPGGSTPPANAAGATTVTASPATAWTTGQYVHGTTTGTAGDMYWSGTAWVAGRAP